jgi:hypothetical protein
MLGLISLCCVSLRMLGQPIFRIAHKRKIFYSCAKYGSDFMVENIFFDCFKMSFIKSNFNIKDNHLGMGAILYIEMHFFGLFL